MRLTKTAPAWLLGLLVGSLAVQGSPSQTPGGAAVTPSIGHDPLECIKVDTFPQVDAAISSPLGVARTRVYFKAHQHPDWYYADMKASETAQFLATLPKPLPETRQLDYYVYALDTQFQTAQTSEFGPQVVKETCRRDAGLWLPPEGGIVVGATKEGQPPIPPGFSPRGIVGFVTVAGVMSVLSDGAAIPTPKGKGGSRAGLLAAVLGGGAAVAGGVLLAGNGGGPTSGPTPTANQPTPAPTAAPTPTPQPSPTPTPQPNPTPTPAPPQPNPTPTPAPTPTPTPQRNLTGAWTGSVSACGCPGDTLNLDLTQSGSSLRGAVGVNSVVTACRLRGGNLTGGSVSGDAVNFTYYDNALGGSVTVQGTVAGNGSGENMSGSLNGSGCGGSWNTRRR